MGSVQRLVNTSPRNLARYIASALILLLIIASNAHAARQGDYACPSGQAPKYTATSVPGGWLYDNLVQVGDEFWADKDMDAVMDSRFTHNAQCSPTNATSKWSSPSIMGETTTTGGGSTYRNYNGISCYNASGGVLGSPAHQFRIDCQTCPPDKDLWNGQCKPKCPIGSTRNPTTGECECPNGFIAVNGKCPNCTKPADHSLGFRRIGDTAQSACVDDCEATAVLSFAVESKLGLKKGVNWISNGQTCGVTNKEADPTLLIDAEIAATATDTTNDTGSLAVVKHTPSNTEVRPNVIDTQPNESYVTAPPSTLIQSTPTTNPPYVNQTYNDYYTVTYYAPDGTTITNTYHIVGQQTFNVTNTYNYNTVVNHSGGPGGGGDSSAPPPYDGDGDGDGIPDGEEDGGGDGDGDGEGGGTCDPETETCEDSPVSVPAGSGRTFGESTAAFIERVKQAPLIEAAESAAEFTAPAGTCDPLVLEFNYMGMGTVSTDLHCQLASTLDMLRWVFLAIYAFLGIRIILSA